MPKKPSGRHEAQRERTRRYRERLRASGTPEADVVDRAVAASVAAVAELLRLQQEDAREAARERRSQLRLLLDLGQMHGEEAEAARRELAVPLEEAVEKPEPMPPADMVAQVLRGAVSLLADRGYSREQAKVKVLRRLGRNGDPAELALLIHRSGVSIRPRRGRASR